MVHHPGGVLRGGVLGRGVCGCERGSGGVDGGGRGVLRGDGGFAIFRAESGYGRVEFGVFGFDCGVYFNGLVGGYAFFAVFDFVLWGGEF